MDPVMNMTVLEWPPDEEILPSGDCFVYLVADEVI